MGSEQYDCINVAARGMREAMLERETGEQMQRSFHQGHGFVNKGSFVCGLVVSAASLTVHTRNVLWLCRP